MLLDGVISQAASGLDAATRQLAVVGQNIANANTVGYVRESVAVTSTTAGGVGMGVRTGVATRTMDAALQAGLLGATGQSAGEQLRSTALAAVDAASGTPGAGQDLASLMGGLRDAFSTLSTDPANQTQQRAVVNAAASLASGIGTVGQAITGARQTLQDGLVDDVSQANAGLKQLGALSDAIMQAQAHGDSTADLEDKRDTTMQSVATLTGARFLRQSNGDLLAVSGGTVLPIRASAGPLSLSAGTVAPGSTAPPLLLNGAPASLGADGGRIGAALSVRDTTLPGMQADLDGFAGNLASGFASAGLTLFSSPGGTIPASSTGFAQVIQVSPAAAASPAVVRDGATASGQAGNAALVTTVLNTVLATGTGTVSAQASTLVATAAGLAATSARQLETDQGVQTSLSTRLASGTAVSVDTEMTSMVRLQNSYGANAKVLSAVQAMYTQLLDAVR